MAPATDVLSNISTVNPDTVPSSQSPCHLLSGSDLSPTQTVHQMSPKLVNVKPVEITIVTRSKSGGRREGEGEGEKQLNY